MAEAINIDVRADEALRSVQKALDEALDPVGSGIRIATETKIVNALHVLRSARYDADVVNRIETVSIWLRLMLAAKRDGRPNFYASRLLRLRRMTGATG